MKMLAWNVRGLSSPSKRALIKSIISSYSLDFIILTETKLQHVTKAIVKSLWSSISINWKYIKAKGKAGGILLMWEDLHFTIENTIEGDFSLSANIVSPNGFSWWLSAIYGPAKRSNRKNFWIELDNLKAICLPNWILGGDFNVIRWTNETSVSNPTRHSLNKFNSFIDQCGLIDPPLTNAKYTWSNLRSPPTLSRLDRFLFSKKMGRKF